MASSRLVEDTRFALRQLCRSPAFSAAVLLCLALGIGATTAIFSVVNAVVLRPLPYREPQNLIRVYSEFPTLGAAGLRRFWISPPEFRDLRQLTQAFETVDAWQPSGANLAGAGAEPLRVNTAFVSSTLLATLGVPPLIGRWIDARDCEPGAPLPLVLGYNLWRGSFGGDPALVGKEVLFNGQTATVAGIMPPAFHSLPATASLPNSGFPSNSPPTTSSAGATTASPSSPAPNPGSPSPRPSRTCSESNPSTKARPAPILTASTPAITPSSPTPSSMRLSAMSVPPCSSCLPPPLSSSIACSKARSSASASSLPCPGSPRLSSCSWSPQPPACLRPAAPPP